MYISAFLTPRKTAIKTLGRFPDLLRRERPSRLLQTVVWEMFSTLQKLTVAGTAPDSHRIPSLWRNRMVFTSSPKRGQKY